MGCKVLGMRFTPVLAGLICVNHGMASAQVAAAAGAPDATRPAATSPASPGNNWWDAPAPTPAAPPAQSVGGPLFRHDAGPGPYNITDYPTLQMGDWVAASAMAARSRAMLARAESELSLTITRQQHRFENSDDFAKASQGEKQAYTAYIAARQQVLGGLFNDPKYHAIMQLHDEISDKIAARRNAHEDATSLDIWLSRHGFEPQKLTSEQMVTLKAMYDGDMQKAAGDDTSKEDVLALATLKMQYASDARAIEIAALGSDDNLKASREKMVDASRRATDLRTQFEQSLHENPEVLVARRNLEDARVAVIEAQALACSTGIASDYALNYSYYLHRNDNGSVYGPYGGAALGGYNSPYWGR